MKNVEIVAKYSSDRLDSFLAIELNISRNYASKLISEKMIKVNGLFIKKSDSVKYGDFIEVKMPPEETPDLSPKMMPLEVVKETERYAIINKPAGIAVHYAPGNTEPTLVNGILHEFEIDDKDNGDRPGIVHRLDKDTTGLLLIAKDTQAREALSNLFKERLVKKKYLAICSGTPGFKTKTINSPIARDKRNRQKMGISADGKPATTIVSIKNVFKKYFLADIDLITGRTHQIRVHMKSIGHPLLGDKLYGGSSTIFKRQALHAYHISFTDPFTQDKISESIDLPKDMQDLISKLD